MKQHLDAKQWENLSEEQKQRLTPSLIGAGDILTAKHYSRYLTIGKLTEVIRHHHQICIYTVDDVWSVQLFDLNDCANDQKDCIYENNSKELVDVLFECTLWILDCLIDY